MTDKMLFILAFIYICTGCTDDVKLRLSDRIGDHMVLQRSQKITFSGSAKPNSEVVLHFSSNTYRTVTESDSTWEISIPPQPPGGPHIITVTASETITIEDVYFGDVWLFSGQSNMERKLSEYPVIAERARTLLAEDFEIRFLDIPDHYSHRPLYGFNNNGWKKMSADNLEQVPAIPAFFSILNAESKKVPVGIITAENGGTPITSWIPADSLMRFPGLQKKLNLLAKENKNWEKKINENELRRSERKQILNKPIYGLEQAVHQPDYDDAEWSKRPFNSEHTYHNVNWFRFSFKASVRDSLILRLLPFTTHSFIYLNGNKVGYISWKDSVQTYSLTNHLKEGSNLLAVRLSDAHSDSFRVNASNHFMLESGSGKVKFNQIFTYSGKVEPPYPKVISYKTFPSFSFNAMIHPVLESEKKGIIWYQGENDVLRASSYSSLFTTLIRSWRKNENIPFLFVQLPSHTSHSDSIYGTSWAELRKAQSVVNKALPNTAMAVSFDTGNPEELHPDNKDTVATRLWNLAEKIVYKSQDEEAEFPVISSFKKYENKVYLNFEHSENGISYEPENGDSIQISGISGSWYPASFIQKGNTLIIWSDEVSNPSRIKYAWHNNPKASIYSSGGLPAEPFHIILPA